MPPFTLNQAARECKRSKATLLDAIRAGRLSAAKDEQGRYQIDPAELFRVYPLNGTEPDAKTEADPTPDHAETAIYREKTALLERIITTLEDERDDLRARLDKSEAARENAAAEIRRLTLMLTHQPEHHQEPAPTTQATPPGRAPAIRPGLWYALAGAIAFAGIAAAAASWWLSSWSAKN